MPAPSFCPKVERGKFKNELCRTEDDTYLPALDNSHRADDIPDALAHLLVLLIKHHAMRDELPIRQCSYAAFASLRRDGGQ